MLEQEAEAAQQLHKLRKKEQDAIPWKDFLQESKARVEGHFMRKAES